MKKKRANISIHLDELSIKILTNLGYLDGRKNVVKGKNLSSFFTNMLKDRAEQFYNNGVFDYDFASYKAALEVFLDAQKDNLRVQQLTESKLDYTHKMFLKAKKNIVANFREKYGEKAEEMLEKKGISTLGL